MTETKTTSPLTETQIQKLLVPAKEAAAMLSLGRSTFWQAVKDGRLPKPVKIGGATRWRVADLHRVFGEPINSAATP